MTTSSSSPPTSHSMGYNFPEFRKIKSIEFTPVTGRPVFPVNPDYDDVLHKNVPDSIENMSLLSAAGATAGPFCLRPLHELTRRGIVPYKSAQSEVLAAFGVSEKHEWIAHAILKTVLPPTIHGFTDRRGEQTVYQHGDGRISRLHPALEAAMDRLRSARNNAEASKLFQRRLFRRWRGYVRMYRARLAKAISGGDRLGVVREITASGKHRLRLVRRDAEFERAERKRLHDRIEELKQVARSLVPGTWQTRAVILGASLVDVQHSTLQFRGTPDCNESAALHSYGLDAHCRSVLRDPVTGTCSRSRAWSSRGPGSATTTSSTSCSRRPTPRSPAPPRRAARPGCTTRTCRR